MQKQYRRRRQNIVSKASVLEPHDRSRHYCRTGKWKAGIVQDFKRSPAEEISRIGLDTHEGSNGKPGSD